MPVPFPTHFLFLAFVVAPTSLALASTALASTGGAREASDPGTSDTAPDHDAGAENASDPGTSDTALDHDAGAESAAVSDRETSARSRTDANDETDAEGAIVAFEAHLSLLSDVADRSLLASAFGYALTVSRRLPSGWLVGARVEHDLWSTFELEGGIDLGALSIAAIVGKLHLGGRVRTSLAIGPSVLLFDTGLDRRGNVGLYFELRPLGIRWSRPRATVVLDPLSFAVVAPVLTNIPLVQIQYRTALQIEIGGGR